MQYLKSTIVFMLIGLFSINLLVIPVMAAEVPVAKADKALVVFYRTGRMTGAAISFNVKHGEAAIGTLASGTMFYRYIEPGQHTFWTEVISQDSVTIEAEAGKTYFIEGISRIGLVVSRPQLRRVEESQARVAIANIK